MKKNYWLFKSEPNVYSIEDLKSDKKTFWEGVRNYQARNFLRDRVQVGDEVFFYHSNADPTGIAGVARVVRSGYPDPAAMNPKSKYYDSTSRPEKPNWYVVDIEFVEKFDKVIELEALRKIPGLEKMPLLQRGQRLSIQPVEEKQWKMIMSMKE